MSEFVIDSFQSARQLNQGRGILLARYVGRAFIPAIIFSWAIFPITHAPWVDIGIVSVGSLIGIGLLIAGVWLAEHQQGEWAARCIVTGIQIATTLLQVFWALHHGIDGVVFALFIAQTIPIGLATALSGVELLRNTLVVTAGITTVLFVGGVLWFHPVLVGSMALIEWLMTVFFIGIIAALLYGGSIFYAQALQEIGTIRNAYERAQRLDELKDQFITHVNHELRTPIMTMQGIIEFLQVARHDMPPEQEEQLFAQASRNGDQLVSLLTRILDVRQIEKTGASVQSEQVTLTEAIAKGQEIVDPLRKRDFQVVLPPELSVWADPQLLQQIIVNLLGNAIKYSPITAPIDVRASVYPTSGTPLQVQLHIRDYGPGVPADQVPLLFHRFVRLPRDLASTIPGSGIGLYLSKIFTESMSGKIWVESAGIEGEGADFILELPTAESTFAVTAIHEKVPLRKQRR